ANLANALGIPPEELQELTGGRRSRRLSKSPATLATAVPPGEATSILGREQEIAAVERAFARGARLVTLVGIGGIGKTRIAREIAERGEPAAELVAWTSLAAITDPAAVLPAVAQAFGLAPSADSPGAIAAAIGGRSALLVLDNLEHLMESASDVGALLRACQHLTIVATSREALRIAGEQTVSIDHLPLPDDAGDPHPDMTANPAVALYLRGVSAGGGSAAVADAVRIVRMLDGLPLAIELAAAQTSTMSSAAIADILQRSGLGALRAGRRDGPARFQTMDAALSWSTDLLPMPAVQLLCLLGAFRGGFTVEAVAGVAGLLGAPDLMEWLPTLSTVHLVRQQPGAGRRLTMLEPVRMFALARLREVGGLDAARLAHARWFTRWAQAQAEILGGPDPLPALDALDADLANVRIALETAAAAGDALATLRAAVDLMPFWEQRGHMNAGRVALSAAIDAAGADPDPSVELMSAMFHTGYIAELQRRHEDRERARARLAALADASGSAEFAARAVLLDALHALVDPDGADRAIALLYEVRRRAEPGAGRFAYREATLLLGNHLHERNDPEGALPLLEESAALFADGDCALDKPIALSRLGFALIALGRIDDAIPWLVDAATITRQLDLSTTAIFPLLGLGHAAALRREPASLARAMVIFGFTDVQTERSGETGSEYVYTPFWDGVVADSRAAAEDALGFDRVQALTDEGRILSLSAVLDIARG
ncbi:MAG: ATP-binding protein, partial [Thermomicrobiales bacterium]